MSDNLYTVFSPQGERFEVTRLNFHDLITHAGWSQSAPTGAQAPASVVEDDQTADYDDPATEADETVVEVAETEETAGEDGDDAPKVRATEEDFADLENKADVAAYIRATYPDAEFDGRLNRGKLVEFAIDLAAE